MRRILIILFVLIIIAFISYFLMNQYRNKTLSLKNPALVEPLPSLDYTVIRSNTLQPIKQFNYINQDGNEYSVYFYGIEEIYLKDINGNNITLKTCIDSNYLTIYKFLNYFENDKNTQKDMLLDGGTIIYKTKEMTIIAYNTLDGNKDVCFAIPELNNYGIKYNH